MASVRTKFIAAAANRYAHAADCSPSKHTVAFGSNRFVALWESGAAGYRGVNSTLPGHIGIVTCVRFIREDLLASADDHGHLLLRERSLDGQWHLCSNVQAHEKGSVSALFSYGGVLASGGSDGKLKIWDMTSAGSVLKQAIDLKGKFPLDVQIAPLPGSSALIMAVASTDRAVRIFLESAEGFSHAATLDGHEDWVRCLAFDNPHLTTQSSFNKSSKLVLASGSQDGNIRLWVIKPSTEGPNDEDNLIDAFERSLTDLGDEAGGRRVSSSLHVLAVNQPDGSLKHYTLSFDALLVGHENHVTSLNWRHSAAAEAVTSIVPTLLSSSTDASLILWSPTTSDSLWVNRERFGDLGGGRAGGFVGASWGRDFEEVMAWGWNGGWKRWRLASGKDETEAWEEVNATTGFQAPVKGLAWDQKGDYCIASSLDQTTRIFGSWNRQGGPSNDDFSTWHEIARPQIHGYDLISPSFINPLRFVSVADEKVARVFDAPQEFVTLANNLHSIRDQIVEESERPRAAVVPPLGLSNKATVEEDKVFQEAQSVPTLRPPLEGELATRTLWPEVEKLFGHGYELYALGVSNSGLLIATACKSTTPEHALIRLHDTGSWRSFGQPLPGHALTITRICFSPDDRFILSSSRDRTWRLFERLADGSYNPLASDKAHARIIWDCAWTKEDHIFATAGRDKLVKVWQASDELHKNWSAIAIIKTDTAATSLDFSSVDTRGRRRMAVGLENGTILIFSSLSNNLTKWQMDIHIDSNLASIDQIHRLAWRPIASRAADDLAIGSEDGTFRILEIPI